LFIIAFIPSIFNLTKYNYLDKFFGNLSYPIYCSHFIGIGFCIKVLKIERNQSYISGLLVLISVLVLSVFLNKYLQAPVDKFRKKFKKSKARINN
jgi:peptidoglycan/LPS O-acetylase OafA/YrhL